MSANDLTSGVEPPVAHPLALELAVALAPRETPKALLLLGIGSGRNVPALLRSGARIEAFEEDAARAAEARMRFAAAAVRVRSGSYAGPFGDERAFAGALSTHALLHVRGSQIAAVLDAIHAALEPGGLFYATFGSTRDRRCGTGRRLETRTYAPSSGPERGVPHTYFDEVELRSQLGRFDAALVEGSAAETAGRWAHSATEVRDLVHWFVRATAR